MIFIVPIIAVFILVWAIDAIYYEPKLPNQPNKIEKNITKDVMPNNQIKK